MYHRLAMTEVVDTLLHLSNFLRHSEEGKARRGNPFDNSKARIATGASAFAMTEEV